MPAFQYPLNLRFKLMALAPRIIITDASGIEQFFVSQRIFKLKEDVRVYNNSNKEQELYRIRADRIIDFSANYHFFRSDNELPLGSVKRKGMRSLWRATYFSDDANGTTSHYVKEDNPWVKIWDGLVGEIPLVGFAAGYVFNPSYTAYRGNDRDDESQPVMTLTKQPAFWEGRYEINLVQPSISESEELQILLSLLMIVQLERRRG